MLKLNLDDLTKSIKDIKTSSFEESNNKDIAIIGMSIKLPMAESTDEFWNNLTNGKNCITELPKGRKDAADSFLRFKREDPRHIKYKKGSYLERLDEFDYKYFNISPREASLIDPNQRIFLQTVVHTIEDAGYSCDKLKDSRTGIYFGYVSDSAYHRLIAEVEPSAIGISIPGNMASIIPGRVSYILDLKGPSIMIDTACSSSLVAVHTACMAIRNGDCDMAIVGSGKMNLLPTEDNNMLGIESKDYTCKAFDDSSEGTCMGEGYMAIMLKPASKAVKDKDNIYAIIKGSAVNQDGASMGLTAPNSIAQADVIDRAWKDADIDPETITYIETHGTGTKLGDPIEVDGITKAFRRYTDRKQFCGIGSVKTNLGHLDSAAGLAGMIKAILSLKNKELPPSINFKTPNRNIGFENSPIYVNHRHNKWKSSEGPRRCGVSAFGLSGTNCHIILEEASIKEIPKSSSEGEYILAISAKNEGALKQLVEEYCSRINEGLFEGILDDLCYTANTGRVHHSYRVVFVGRDSKELGNRMHLFLDNNKNDEDNGVFHREFSSINSNKENNNSKASIENEQKSLTRSANEKIKEYKQCKRLTKESFLILDELSRLYVKGANINWDDFYLQQNYAKVSLPVYPFEKTSCWVKVPEVALENIDNSRKSNKIEIKNKPEVVIAGRDNNTYSLTEKKVAQVWGEVLGFDKIDINEDFYDLGGDSIIATDIANGLSRALDEDIKVTHVMRSLTVKAFAEFFDKEIAKNDSIIQEDALIKPIDKKEYYALSAAQKRIYMLDQLSDTGVSYNMPVAVMVEGDIDKVMVENVFNKIVERHEALRTSFKTVSGEPVQIIHDKVDFKMDFIEANEDELSGIVNSLIKPFDLTKAPLFRAALIKIAQNRHLLFYDVYHIVADGFSLAILLNEFKYLYQNKELPELSFQYKDFAEYHNDLLSTDKIKNQEKYWLEKYSGEIKNLDMPLDYKRPKTLSFVGNSIEFELSPEMVSKMYDFVQKKKMTMNTFMLSTYALLIGMYSNQGKVSVGTLVTGRTHEAFQLVVGMFVNYLPLIFEYEMQDSFMEYLNKSGDMLLDSFGNQEYPFDLIVKNTSSKLDRSRNPLFDTVFIFHNELKSENDFNIEGLTFQNYDLQTNSSVLDFKIDTFLKKDGGIKCVLQYNTSLFKEESMLLFTKHFSLLLEKGINSHQELIKDINVIAPEEKSTIEEKRRVNSNNKIKAEIAISATFTSEPIQDYIAWWCEQAGIEANISFAPYNQVFQQLLDTESLLSKNKEANLLLVRAEDWIRADQSSDEIKCRKIDESFDNMVEILKGYSKSTPCFLCIFPVSTHLSLSSILLEHIEGINRKWQNALEGCQNVYTIDFTTLNKAYSVREVFDKYRDREGHIPFSEEYYAAMGTYIARKLCSLLKPQFKVIVLDCDNTLWQGICGEEGANGVTINNEYLALQRFMLEKYNSGMLLAICSKNNEQDVWNVFDSNPQMLLKKEHFVSWRINWKSKAENIKSISQELNLGMDSFIFIDDSAIECAIVIEECPSVLTIKLPEETKSIPAFLEHIWAFDILKVTDADKSRSKQYTTEKKRQEIQGNSISLNDFIKSLELRMSFNQMDSSQIQRVSQLTMRTNQFNLSTIRRTEAELNELIHTNGYKCWVVEVIDRFGDYGLVGVVITKEQENSLFIDTFLLSCRVLGRGIEDAIIYNIVRFANEIGLDYIEAKLYPTEKNKPFVEFIERSKWERIEEINNSKEHYYSYLINTKSVDDVTNLIECHYLSNLNKSDIHTEAENNDISLHHIAIAVSDIELAKEEYLIKGFKCGGIVHDTLQNAYLMMCTKDGHDAVELVAPVNNESPVKRIIDENGEIPYHMCFKVDNCHKYLEDLRYNGIEFVVVSENKKAILFNNQEVTFINITDFGLVEILESKEESSNKKNNSGLNLNTLQIVTGDHQKPTNFLKHMGYIQEKSIEDVTNKLNIISFYKSGSGKVELVLPLDNSSQEYAFLKKNDANPYRLYTNEDAGSLAVLSDNNWSVEPTNKSNFLHEFYLTALKYYSASDIVMLPKKKGAINTLLADGYEPPANELEAKLAIIWQDVLGIEKIGINNNFFDLGGHSIKATDLVSTICKEFSVDINLTDIFRAPTIRKLAECISGSDSNVFDEIMPVEHKDYYSMSATQKRIYLIYQLNSKDTSYNIPAAVMIEGEIDRERFENVFKKIIQRHESLRTSFRIVEGEPVQIVHDEVDFRLEYIKSDITKLDSVINSLMKPFDLAKAPLLRACIIRIAEDKHVLYFEMHHIMADGASYALLINEFVELYQEKDITLPVIQYKDYAAWHNELLSSDAMKAQEAYWLEQYSTGYKPLEFPLDYKRPQIQVFTGDRVEFTISELLVDKLNKTAQKQKTTLNTILVSLYSLLLHKYSEQEEIVVGSVVAGRRHANLSNVMGMFINFLPIKFRVDNDNTIEEFLEASSRSVLEAYDNQDYPFDMLVEKVMTKAERSRNPLFDTMFIFHNEFEAIQDTKFENLKISSYEINTKTSKLDFKIDAYPSSGNQLRCVLEYNTSLLKEESVKSFIESFRGLIYKAVSEPQQRISKLKIFSDEEQSSIERKKLLNSATQNTENLVVSATFTSEPVEEYIKFWCEKFNININVQFAPYNQVFQQLLDPESILMKNNGINLLLVRFEDWLRDSKLTEEEQYSLIEENYEKLIQILNTSHGHIPVLIGIFPVATYLPLSKGMITYINSMYKRLRGAVNSSKNIYIIDFTELDSLYSVVEVFDLYKDKEGHMPFSDEYYAAMGTSIARRICAWKRQQFKVVVLDCDNTLWNGICGEDGALGVKIDSSFAELQKFMIEKYNSGMLIALCSKNNEQDVWDVFENNPDMLMKKEHIVSWRINWQSKAENIKSLANELNLGMDSFIFLDDNPVECALVMEECKEVLTLRVPEDTTSIPAYLKHIWAFDIFRVTEEDKNRTKMYISEKNRKELRDTQISLNDFIKSLEIKMSLNHIDKSQVERVAQLTQRTNQFNLSTKRYTENDMKELSVTEGTKCWVIEVTDKFGDYGLVGVVITKEKENILMLDTFLLSCRVLGRGVEDAILSSMCRYAREIGAEFLEACFYPTQKNKPFEEFLQRSKWVRMSRTDSFIKYRLNPYEAYEDTEMICSYYMSSYKEEIGLPEGKAENQTKTDKRISDIQATDEYAINQLISSIQEVAAVKEYAWEVKEYENEKLLHSNHLFALKYFTAKRIMNLPILEGGEKAGMTEYKEPSNEIEKGLVEIWEMIFNTQSVGVNDSFIELGGSSLKAISLVTQIYKRFSVEVSLVDVFNNPTIELLAKCIESSTKKAYYQIPKTEEKTYYQLSSAQKRIYMMQQLSPDSIAYNEPAIVEIEGIVNKKLLEDTFYKLIQRHESLRTAFVVFEDEPVQKIHEEVEFSITYTNTTENDFNKEVNRLIRAFDLAKPPLLNVNLISMSEWKHVLVCNIHHIITDGVSTSILIGEFIRLYNGEQLAELRIQYKDFSEWQNNLFEADEIRNQEEYWINKFSGKIPVLNLPADFTRPRELDFNGATLKQKVEKELVYGLEKLVIETGTTLYMVLLAAFNILLSKYSGQEDIIIGSPVAGRPHPDLHNIIGMFVNTLCMRNQPKGDKTVAEFLQEVKTNSLEAFENQDFQFEHLVKKLGIDKDTSRNPLFDVVFVLQQNDISDVRIDGLSFKRYEHQNEVSKFDVTLEVEALESGINLLIKYSTAIFSTDTIEKMMKDFIKILEVIIKDRSVCIKDIRLVEEYKKRERELKEEVAFDF